MQPCCPHTAGRSRDMAPSSCELQEPLMPHGAHMRIPWSKTGGRPLPWYLGPSHIHRGTCYCQEGNQSWLFRKTGLAGTQVPWGRGGILPAPPPHSLGDVQQRQETPGPAPPSTYHAVSQWQRCGALLPAGGTRIGVRRSLDNGCFHSNGQALRWTESCLRTLFHPGATAGSHRWSLH